VFPDGAIFWRHFRIFQIEGKRADLVVVRNIVAEGFGAPMMI